MIVGTFTDGEFSLKKKQNKTQLPTKLNATALICQRYSPPLVTNYKHFNILPQTSSALDNSITKAMILIFAQILRLLLYLIRKKKKSKSNLPR